MAWFELVNESKDVFPFEAYPQVFFSGGLDLIRRAAGVVWLLCLFNPACLKRSMKAALSFILVFHVSLVLDNVTLGTCLAADYMTDK